MSNVAKKHAPELKDLHEQKWFQGLIKDIDSEKPKIPLFNPSDEKHNATAWAYYSGRLEGYKLAISHLGVKIDE